MVATDGKSTTDNLSFQEIPPQMTSRYVLIGGYSLSGLYNNLFLLAVHVEKPSKASAPTFMLACFRCTNLVADAGFTKLRIVTTSGP